MAKTPDLEKIVSSAATRAKVVISDTDLGRIRSCQPESALAEWIQENLVPGRFLSKEEVGLFQSIDRPEVGSEPGIVPLREEGLLSVIADLDAETEALNRQASVLEAQRALVERRMDLLERYMVEHWQRKSRKGTRTRSIGWKEKYLRQGRKLRDCNVQLGRVLIEPQGRYL